MYAIRITRQFFGPRTEKSYLTDGLSFDRRAEFKTRAEADALVEQLDKAVYYTSHNESGRAEYKVVRIK